MEKIENVVLEKIEQKRGRGRPRKNSPDAKPSENPETNEIINKIAIIENNDEDNTSYEIKYKRERAINNVLSDTILNLIKIKHL